MIAEIYLPWTIKLSQGAIRRSHTCYARLHEWKLFITLLLRLAHNQGLHISATHSAFPKTLPHNGLEFASMFELVELGLQVYFAYPYSSYERETNERHNRIIRTWIPKGKDIDNYDEWFIEDLEDCMNNLPRKKLGYKIPAQLFKEELDKIYRKTAYKRLFRPCHKFCVNGRG